ncbi:MAG TPA: CusA/CzcA family heavy metal efflux RND transporter [Vicinamibacterales bacterium]|nr:CusA/CzcA family heavy metal efflux RND transporter [Vicinamibacterales bacterium]
MINRLIELSLKNRFLVIAVYLALAGWGWWAVTATPIDAIPDLSDNQVIVFTDWPGQSAQEVEDQVTYPLTVNLQGLAGVRVVRSQSAFGFSMIYIVFQDDVELYFARARVLERMNLVGKLLPEGAVPTLGPDATGVGHVLWYTVESPTLSLRELRSLQDWFVRYQLNAVPGVAEVASVGGHVQQYQVEVDPNRLRTFGISLGQVVEAVRRSNANVGGNVLEANGAWSIVRGVGLIQSVADIETIVIGSSGGVPIYVSQVGTVQIGNAFRVASLVKGGNEAVGGVVVARTGVNTKEVIDAVKARIAQIQPGLPADVRIVPFYDRSQLIEQAVGTLRTALIEAIVVVTLAHVLFLMHLRSILIVTIPLPLAVLLAFLGMYYAGVTSNIMSLAGIAIAIGVLVDAGIVVTENAFRFLETRRIDPRDRMAVAATVLESTRLVGRPIFFSMGIILLAFLPVFALTGQEGKLFHPLAFTKTFAVLAATISAVTLVPVLCTLLLAGKFHKEEDNPVMRVLQRLYRPALEAALTYRRITVALAALLFVGALLLARGIGNEFMPPLNEGDLMFMPIADPSISLEENTKIAARQNTALMTFQEVDYVVAKVARADTSTDPAPLNMTETIVHLKPRDQWRPGMTLARLRSEMSTATQLPGVSTIWTMPIINRIDMLTTGIRSEVGVKIFGTDLAVLEQLARQVSEVVRQVPGASNVYPEQVTSGQYLNIQIDRQAAARYGIGVGDIQEVIQTAVGESVLAMTIEGRQRFPVRVRYAAEYRADPQAVGSVLVSSPSGVQIPLSQLASIEPARGPAMISSENGLLLATVLLNVQDRDVGSFVEEAKAKVTATVSLPAGYYLGWSGRYENQERARQRLLLVVPMVLLVIFVLLYFTYHSFVEAAHVLMAVPFALTGGVYLLWLLGYNFSVAVWVGFIALFGTAVQTGMVMVIYLEEVVVRKQTEVGGTLTRASLREAVTEGALLRLRPKVMTVSTVVAGLLPIMWSTSVGAEVMKPLATPVLGGMLSSLVHVLIVTPVIFYWLRARHLPPGEPALHRPVPSDKSPAASPPATRRWVVPLIVVVALIAVAVGVYLSQRAGGGATVEGTDIAPIQTVQSGNLEIRLVSPTGALSQGRSAFVIEFRDAATGALTDVGTVRAGAAMTMPGMVMSGGVQVTPSGTPGRYTASGEFGMAGAWQFTVEWQGPAGNGKVAFEGSVQ